MTRRLLVVDDDEVTREITMLAIERAPGWQARPAASAEEALAAVGQERPDAVLLDVRMPGMSGPELVGVLRTSGGTRDLPVILLTASSGDREMAQLRELPVSGVLRKPYDPLTLPDVIATLLGWAPG